MELESAHLAWDGICKMWTVRRASVPPSGGTTAKRHPRHKPPSSNMEIDLPTSVTLTCIKPIWVPIRAGSFSRENALYGATIFVVATCHDEPSRVTAMKKTIYFIRVFVEF